MASIVKGLRNSLVERVIKCYVNNVDEVVNQFSIRKLLFGSVHLDKICLKPEVVQDLVFVVLPCACEIVQFEVSDVDISVDWLEILCKSTGVRISHLTLEVVVHEPNCEDDPMTRPFWKEQRLRAVAGARSISRPVDITLVDRVVSGLDVLFEAMDISIRSSKQAAASFSCSVNSLRFCPATFSGDPTTDISEAIKQNVVLQEISCNHHCEFGSLLISPLNQSENDELEAANTLRVGGFVLHSVDQLAILNQRQTSFCTSSLSNVCIQSVEMRSTLDNLGRLVNIAMCVSTSDSLRMVWLSEEEEEKMERLYSARFDDMNDITEAASPASEPFRERFVSQCQVKGDMAQLLSGCTRKSRRKTEARVRFETDADETRDDSADESVDDSEEFRDCEEFELLKLPDGEATSEKHKEQCRDREHAQLTRVLFRVEQCGLHIIRRGGVLSLKFARLNHSCDMRYNFSKHQLDSLRDLFHLPKAWPEAERSEGLHPGVIYAGASIDLLSLVFYPSRGEFSALVSLDNGLSIRCRQCLLRQKLQHVLEVELMGLTMSDGAKEEIEAIADFIAASTNVAQPSITGQEKSQISICCSIEALDVHLHVGPSIGQPTWYVSWPCVRISNVFSNFDEIWEYSLSGFTVTRSLRDRLGMVEISKSSPSKAPCGLDWAPPFPLRAKLKDNKMIMPLASLDAVACDLSQCDADMHSEADSCKHSGSMAVSKSKEILLDLIAPVSVGGLDDDESYTPTSKLRTARFHIDAGQEVSHRIENLYFGDTLEWIVQEDHELTVDVSVILRSSCRLHSARRLRDTVRTSRWWDSFTVTEDFEEKQLPLTMEINISNSFSWWTRKQVVLYFSHPHTCHLHGAAED